MKYSLLVVSAALCCCVVSCKGGVNDEGSAMREKITASPKMVRFLGADVVEILQAPERIESYRVGMRKSRQGDTIGGYPVLGRGPALSAAQVTQLASLLLDEHSYLFDVVKKCLFLPEYAFRAVRGGKNVVVLICFSCEELLFVYENREILEDFDRITPKVRTLIAELFN